jgi:hypothetical protein
MIGLLFETQSSEEQVSVVADIDAPGTIHIVTHPDEIMKIAEAGERVEVSKVAAFREEADG